MRMRIIPDELRRAHEDGNVVLFCGAGASYPAGLPTFWGLTKNVLENITGAKETCKLGTPEAAAWAAFEANRYDEAFNILEHPRGRILPADVRKFVGLETGRKPKTLDKHVLLSRLARLDTQEGRLVTTNFDHCFTKAVTKLRRLEGSKEKSGQCVSPALPPAKPSTLSGLIYLHGKLDDTPSNRPTLRETYAALLLSTLYRDAA